MTIRRVDDAILLEDVCPVDDAEALMETLQANGASIDVSGCTHLHTACLQIILAARLPVYGTPVNAALARWLAPLLAPAGPNDPATRVVRTPASPDPETALATEA
jgi:hypothetical protein